MKQYHDLLNHVLTNGVKKEDRTGTGTISTFGYQMRFDLSEGFPMMTTKRISLNLIASELLWFLKGDTNIKYLLENNNNIWNEWAFKKWVESGDYVGPDMTNFGIRAATDPEFNEEYQAMMDVFKGLILNSGEFSYKYGNLGDVYGKQWRKWEAREGGFIDQIRDVIESIKTNPDSRRHIVSAWNPEDVPSMALPPCHTLFQFYVAEGKLSCQLYQRSGDVFLGVPFNIASYALLTHLIAQECGLEVGEFVHTLGDAHIYLNHIDQVKEQLSRDFKELPKLDINPDLGLNFSIFNVEMDDIVIIGYDPHPPIKAPIAV